MGLAETDITLLAAERLEAAVERLIAAVEERLTAPAPRPAPVPPDMVPRAEVEALAARLDETLARLRAALDEGEG
jgi:hypothetical protein